MRLLGDPIFTRFVRMRKIDLGMPQQGMIQGSGSTFGCSHHKKIGSAKGHFCHGQSRHDGWTYELPENGVAESTLGRVETLI